MKIIVAALFLICVACGTAAAEPEPTPSLSPDYKVCVTLLAYLAMSHEHSVEEERGMFGFGTLQTTAPELSDQYAGFATDTTFQTPKTQIERHCAGLLDETLLTQLTGS